MADAFDQKTLRFYADEAPTYVASGPNGRSRHLENFLQRLAPNARVLELGCGGGIDAEYMLAQGFDVEPTDGVSQVAEKASTRLGRKVRVMRFDELDTFERYEAVWANASLLHVPRESLPGTLSLIWRALKPGGWHFGSYKGGGHEGRDSHDRYFNYMTSEELHLAYTKGLRWAEIELTEYEGGGFEGRSGPWVAVTVRKPAISSAGI